jgi:hypothetical protein
MMLALRLGRTLGELGQSMSSAEFALWIELHRREPIDESREDLRTGIIASAIANWAGKMLKEGAKALSPLDFMPFLDRGEEEVVVEPDPVGYFKGM